MSVSLNVSQSVYVFASPTHRFTMSFNRHNLKYSILPKKPKKVDEDCINWIKKYYPRECTVNFCI